MTEEKIEDQIEKLKQKRTGIQTAFTKRANHLTSRANALEERDLKSEWRNLKVEHTRVTDAGFEYAMALRATEDDEALKKADLIDEKTTECDRKFDQVKQLVLNSLWTRFAEEQISKIVQEATSALDQAEAVDYQKLSKMERELRNKNLEREVYEVNNIITEWTDMIPQAKLTESKDRSRALRKRHAQLWDKWTWQRNAWSDEEVEQEEQTKLKVDENKAEKEKGWTSEPVRPISPSPKQKFSCPEDSRTSEHDAQPNPSNVPTHFSMYPSM